MNRSKEINDRLLEIRSLLDSNEAHDLDALETEIAELQEEQRSIKEKQDRKKAMLDGIANGTEEVTVIETVELKEAPVEERSMENLNALDAMIQTRAYEDVFAKKFTMSNPTFSAEEQRILNTTNGAALVPHVWLSEIYDQIRETHPILQDLTWNNISAIVEIPKRVSIVSGDAAVMEEGNCPVGEENEFISVQVDLIEIQKMLEITAKMGQLLPEAFKSWLVAEVRDRIGHQLAVQTVAKIKEVMLADNKLTAATAGSLTKGDLLNLFAAADGDGVAKVYANRKTVFANIASMEGLEGQNAYISSLQDSISGRILGTDVRQESAMADGELLLLFPSEVFFNVPGGIRMKQMEDPCFKIQISGITFMGLALKYDKGAALLTVGEAAPGV